jgi:hypothetical protein
MSQFKLAFSAENETKRIFEMGIDPKDFGKPDQLRYRVLIHVMEEQYEPAIEELRTFYKTESVFPTL